MSKTKIDEIAEGETLSERAAGLIQRDILTGEYQPRARLAVHDLAKRYEIGATPLREALSRLMSQGLIVSAGRRGFRVADTSQVDLEDITRLRVLIEREALRLSMKNGTDVWEVEVISALHLLRKHVDQRQENSAEGINEFDQRHKGFHTAIIAGCGSIRMLETASILYDQAYRYRRLMMAQLLTDPKQFIIEHEKLAEVVLRRDQDAALALLEAHLRSTIDTIYPQGKK